MVVVKDCRHDWIQLCKLSSTAKGSTAQVSHQPKIWTYSVNDLILRVFKLFDFKLKPDIRWTISGHHEIIWVVPLPVLQSTSLKLSQILRKTRPFLNLTLWRALHLQKVFLNYSIVGIDFIFRASANFPTKNLNIIQRDCKMSTVLILLTLERWESYKNII